MHCDSEALAWVPTAGEEEDHADWEALAWVPAAGEEEFMLNDFI